MPPVADHAVHLLENLAVSRALDRQVQVKITLRRGFHRRFSESWLAELPGGLQTIRGQFMQPQPASIDQRIVSQYIEERPLSLIAMVEGRACARQGALRATNDCKETVTMAKVSVSIQADEKTLNDFRNRLKTDPSVVQELSTNPKATLAKYGIQVDDDTANKIRQHFGAIGTVNPQAVVGPTVAVAVAVGPVVAVAI